MVEAVPELGVTVKRGPVLDGVGGTIEGLVEIDANRTSVDVAQVLRETGAHVLVSYLPVGSQEATEFYAESALAAGVAFVNCTPERITVNPLWAERFRKAGVPLVGDDVKSQLGATFIHRALIESCTRRGMIIDRTYQLNFGGNTDFLNMQDQQRAKSKRSTKMAAVASMVGYPIAAAIGPSEYVAFLRDRKVCYLRLEGRGFLGMPFDIELRLSVEDSPNSAGVVIDAVRAAKVALDLGFGGPVEEVSCFLFKNPPRQIPDQVALLRLEEFCNQDRVQFWSSQGEPTVNEDRTYIHEVAVFIREQRRPLPSTHPARLAVFEGLDGAGKTTLVSSVLGQLRKRGTSPILVNPSHPVFHDPLLVAILDGTTRSVLRSGDAAQHNHHFFESFAMIDAFRYCLLRDASIASIQQQGQLVLADSWCYKRMVKYLILARHFETRTPEEWRRAYRRIVTMYLPALCEQLAFLIDISPELSLKRKRGDYGMWESWDLSGKGESADQSFFTFQSEIWHWMRGLAEVLDWVVIGRDYGEPTADNRVAADMVSMHLVGLIASQG